MFRIKQWIKMLLQNVLLPLVYRLYCHRPLENGLVLFADAHHGEIPFSMRRMYEVVRTMAADGHMPEECPDTAERTGIPASPQCRQGMMPDGSQEMCTNADNGVKAELRIETFVTDFDGLSFFAMAKYLLRFMRRYAVAEYVFICDYFLPVSSCRKRPETKVVQLWHSCGLMKKIAYDTGEDIPKGYHGSMFDNYTYLTLSAEACIPVHEKALRLSREHIFATGISRTDDYFDEEWNARCRENFRQKHPEAAGRRVAVWAPTFRGNAGRPRLEGLEEIRRVAGDLQDEWFFIIKAHPHIDHSAVQTRSVSFHGWRDLPPTNGRGQFHSAVQTRSVSFHGWRDLPPTSGRGQFHHEKISNSEIPTEELFPVADVLITDYSSVLFDYLLYRKPVVLFAPDLEDYEKTRGFYIDYRRMPFPLAQTREELSEALK
ncbi:MAG: CDP-glycerol glycerophosphotransferase family protein, partial [Clostridiales bacterium]|nr:CDP-glycerol glycerophosphotransferase family protein [Clostridiales bacterium]